MLKKDLHFEDIMASREQCGRFMLKRICILRISWHWNIIRNVRIYVDHSGPLIGPGLDIKRVEPVLL